MYKLPALPTRKQARFKVGLFVLALSLCTAISMAAGLTEFSANLLSAIAKRWGQSAVPRLLAWKEFIQEEKPAALGQWSPPKTPVVNTLKNTNRFFNKIPYQTDQAHWGVTDYWATPVEMLASNAGDCEDYAAAKYFSLRDLGAPAGQLRMVYVRALKINEAHMVLAWYPTPEAEPYILDILTGEIKPASQRTDLEPVYSFNDDDIWAGDTQKKGGASQIRFWKDLKEKIAREQAM
ncbi:transglutaminase-like cysteine peptidase [Iodobacter sp. LRB]|uniref:transglutaminase-like cysteine peptidase n=1 Tax=unclassified Iodobacter TaxID=235634 RepID=UPI001C557EA4|nr:transglutaminase-like cysteine peptidase [Iodobacter sp. BJB302]